MADFTYVATWGGFVHVAFVIAALARRIPRVRLCRPEDRLWLAGVAHGRGRLCARCPGAGIARPQAPCGRARPSQRSRRAWRIQSVVATPLMREVAMSIRERRSHRSGRAPLLSPGRPSVAGRDERQRFWACIAVGMTSEDAAVEAGVSQPVGTRWFRKAGGMPPAMFRPSAKPLSGRYLSLAEREEIALLRVQGHSVQAIGRQLGRSASTISRELRRNAATRSGGLEYRATTAQWHAERSARRPKPTKLAENPALRTYVEERLAGVIVAPSGVSLPGPAVSWKGRRHGQRQDSAMGQGMEPGADCPSLVDRLPGRQDDAHQP